MNQHPRLSGRADGVILLVTLALTGMGLSGVACFPEHCPGHRGSAASGHDAAPWPTEESCDMAARPSLLQRLGATRAIQPSPPGPMPGLQGVTQLSSDEISWNTCALLSDGTARCWGISIRGPLGDNPDHGRPGPMPGLAKLMEIVPQNTHNCDRLTDGTVRCWGSNLGKQLGPAVDASGSRTPVPLPGLTKVTQIATGMGFTCVRLTTGEVQCWGNNSKGELGDGTTSSRGTPRTVEGLGTVESLSVGVEQSCALLINGTVRCWGAHVATRCNDAQTIPIAVPGIANATAVAVGRDHACVLLRDGTAMCWGGNEGGQLGDGTLAHRFLPVPVGGLSGATKIAAGNYHSCALIGDGTVRCWGLNHCGQVDGGASPSMSHSTPVAVPGLNEVVELSLTDLQSCARRSDGTVWCWGATTPEQFRQQLEAESSANR